MPQDDTTFRAVSRAQQYREAALKKKQGEPWTAPSGMEVMVRKPDLEDQAALDLLPSVCRAAIAEATAAALNAGQTENPSVRDIAAAMMAGKDAEQVIAFSYNLSAAYVIAGWIDPQVVMTEAEITDPERQIAMPDVDRRDRLAFMVWAQRGEEAVAAPAVAFPAERASGVGTVPALQDVRSEAI